MPRQSRIQDYDQIPAILVRQNWHCPFLMLISSTKKLLRLITALPQFGQ
jgi:hypothetical protein